MKAVFFASILSAVLCLSSSAQTTHEPMSCELQTFQGVVKFSPAFDDAGDIVSIVLVETLPEFPGGSIVHFGPCHQNAGYVEPTYDCTVLKTTLHGWNIQFFSPAAGQWSAIATPWAKHSGGVPTTLACRPRK